MNGARGSVLFGSFFIQNYCTKRSVTTMPFGMALWGNFHFRFRVSDCCEYYIITLYYIFVDDLVGITDYVGRYVG